MKIDLKQLCLEDESAFIFDFTQFCVFLTHWYRRHKIYNNPFYITVTLSRFGPSCISHSITRNISQKVHGEV